MQMVKMTHPLLVSDLEKLAVTGDVKISICSLQFYTSWAKSRKLIYMSDGAFIISQ